MYSTKFRAEYYDKSPVFCSKVHKRSNMHPKLTRVRGWFLDQAFASTFSCTLSARVRLLNCEYSMRYIELPELIFSNWYSWDNRINYPLKRYPGVYAIAISSDKLLEGKPKNIMIFAISV